MDGYISKGVIIPLLPRSALICATLWNVIEKWDSVFSKEIEMISKRQSISWGLLALTATCGLLVVSQSGSTQPSKSQPPQEEAAMTTVSVRYIVNDVDAAVEFYTQLLGFRLDLRPAPGFASLSRGGLRLLLNKPGAGGAGQAMPDGRKPEPGGWNRIQLEVTDLAAEIEKLRKANAHFRNDLVIGNGGKQILLDDPAGNPIELFEPNRK